LGRLPGGGVLVARSVLRADLSRLACALALVRPSARLDRVAMHDNISVICDANVHNLYCSKRTVQFGILQVRHSDDILIRK
jgi:hypothetical protein